MRAHAALFPFLLDHQNVRVGVFQVHGIVFNIEIQRYTLRLNLMCALVLLIDRKQVA